MGNDELSRLKKTLENQGLSPSTKKAIENRIKKLTVPVNKGVIKHIENVKSQVENRKDIAQKIISKQKPSPPSKQEIWKVVVENIPSTSGISKNVQKYIRSDFENSKPKPVVSKPSYIGQNKKSDIDVPLIDNKNVNNNDGKTITDFEKEAGKEAGLDQQSVQVGLIEGKNYQNYQEYKKFEEEKKELSKRLSGGYGETQKNLEKIRGAAAIFLSPSNPLGVRTFGEELFGDPKTKNDRKLDIYTEMITGLEKSRRREGWFGVAKESYKPGGFGFTFTSTAVTSYGLGAGMGALKGTRLGSKVLLTSRGLTKAGKPFYNVTLGGAVEGGFGAYGGFETYKNLKDVYSSAGKVGLGTSLLNIGFTMPLGIGLYTSGAKAGLGYVQRKSALSTVKNPLDRVRQEGIYEAADIAMRIKTPKYKTEPFDFRSLENVDVGKASEVITYYKSAKVARPRLGGSASTEAQIPSTMFRSGNYPKGLVKYYLGRQTSKRPIVSGGAKDIDLLIREWFGSRARVDKLNLSKPHVVDIPQGGYRPGRYYWGGWKELGSTKIKIFDTLTSKSMKIRALSLKEQFMRKGVSILPSESKLNAYRSYKDIFDWYDVGKSFKNKKLDIAMDKVVNPQKYTASKIGFNEKLVKRFGYAVEPKVSYSSVGDASYIYPSYSMPKSYGIINSYGFIPKSVYPSYAKFNSKVSNYSSKNYKPPITPTYKPPYKPTYKPTYKPPSKPPSKPPITPTYKPPSKPPSKPPYKPPYKNPKKDFFYKLEKKKIPSVNIPLTSKYRFREFKISSPLKGVKL